MWVFELSACRPEPEGGTDSAPEETATTPTETADSDSGPSTILLDDANNYSMEAAIDIPSVAVKELSDIRIGWEAVSQDLQCHDVDPVADIDVLAAMAFPYLSQEEVELGLAQGTLEQVDLGGYVNASVGDATEWPFADLFFLGVTDVDIEEQFAEGSATWMFIVTTGEMLGVGARTMMFLEPRADTEVLEADFASACGYLDIDPDLDALSPVPVAAAAASWPVDWEALDQDGQGNDFSNGSVDQALLAWYPGYDNSAIETDFFDLEANATRMWTGALDGSAQTSLESLTDADGSPFAGFTEEGDGLWLFALRCTTCPNPAPPFLTVLQPD